MSHRDRLIKKVDEHKDIVLGDDGYYVFWPIRNHGALNANDLRIIADELDKRNEAWDDMLNDLPVSEEWTND